MELDQNRPLYATFNIEKVRTLENLQQRHDHNKRITIKSTIHKDKIHLNISNNIDTYKVITERIKQINKERVEAGVRKLRSDMIPAVELVLGASGAFFDDKSDKEVKAWAKTQLDWAIEYYKGKGKVISYDVHFDESNPHVHIVFLPEISVVDKKTGNRVPSLSASRFEGGLGHRKWARTEHAKANLKYGLERGIDYHEEGLEPPVNKTTQQMNAESARLNKKNKELATANAELSIALLEKAKDFKAIESSLAKIPRNLLTALLKGSKVNAEMRTGVTELLGIQSRLQEKSKASEEDDE